MIRDALLDFCMPDDACYYWDDKLFGVNVHSSTSLVSLSSCRYAIRFRFLVSNSTVRW